MTDSFELDTLPADTAMADMATTPENLEVLDNTMDAMEAAEAPAAEEPNGFALLGLAPELLQAVADLGFTQPTTVQLRTVPLAMQAVEGDSGKFSDLMVSSQTGSGKTAAFLLPVLHTLLMQQQDLVREENEAWNRQVAEAAERGEPVPKRAKRKDPTNPRNFKAAAPGALILCPTRELAQQVAHDAIELVRHCKGLRVANVVGGMPYQLQIAKLQNADLVVATPGRLLDLQRSMQLKLDKVQFLVVDEADRMLDLGFADDLAEVNQLTVQRRQTMMFSATFAPRIQQLATRVMRQPQKIQVDSPQEKHANIKQVLFWADNSQHKRKLLDHWLRDTTINQAIVFASTQIECDGLANDLQQDGFDAVALHGALSQGLRNRRLMALRQGQVQILVATDVAARGIDVPTITHVFNFGLPMKAEDYTHRIGRTGRAGRDGLAVTFAEVRDRRKIFDIEAYTRQPIASEVVPGLEPQQRAPQARMQGDFGRGRDRDYSSPSRGKFGGGGGGGRPANGRDGDFGRKPGFGDAGARRFGGQRDEGFAPRNEGFAPRNEGFAPRNEGFAPRGDNFPPRGDFANRRPPANGANAGFAPRNEGMAPRSVHVKPGGAGKVFVPRDAKRPAAPAKGGKTFQR